MRRVSTDFTGAPRPVSFSAKFSRVHPATTGVTVLEHMERLDQVEAGLKRLGIEEEVIDEEEVDVGMMRAKSASGSSRQQRDAEDAQSPSGRSERLPAVQEVEITDDGESISEEDLVALSKSMPQLEASPRASQPRWTSYDDRLNLDWMDIDSTNNPKRRLVISEVSSPAS